MALILYKNMHFLFVVSSVTQPRTYKLNLSHIEYNVDSAMCYGVVSSWMKTNNCNSIAFDFVPRYNLQ